MDHPLAVRGCQGQRLVAVVTLSPRPANLQTLASFTPVAPLPSSTSLTIQPLNGSRPATSRASSPSCRRSPSAAAERTSRLFLAKTDNRKFFAEELRPWSGRETSDIIYNDVDKEMPRARHGSTTSKSATTDGRSTPFFVPDSQ